MKSNFLSCRARNNKQAVCNKYEELQTCRVQSTKRERDTKYSENILVPSEDKKYPAGTTVQTGSWVEVLQFYLTWTRGGPSSARPPGSPVSAKPMLVFPSILPFLNLSFPQPQPAMSSAQIRCAEPREVPLTRGQGEEGSLHLIVGQLQKTWCFTLYTVMWSRCPSPRC